MSNTQSNPLAGKLVVAILKCNNGQMDKAALKYEFEAALEAYGSLLAAIEHYKELYIKMGSPVPAHLKQ